MRVYRQNPRTAARVLEGQAFVVTPDDQILHTLNGTATQIWECAAGGCTAAQAAEALVRRYQVDTATATRDAEACCEDLLARHILVAE